MIEKIDYKEYRSECWYMEDEADVLSNVENADDNVTVMRFKP